MILQITYYILFLAHLICVLKRKNDAALIYVTVFILGFMFYANDASYGDHVTYALDFYNKDRSNTGDPLYLEYMLLMRKLGITSYQTFLLSIYIFELIFITLGTLKFTNNFHAIFALSMLYIFPFFSVGLRYSMAISIFIFGLRFLVDRKFVCFFVSYVIATCFHLCIAPTLILFICFYPKFIDDKCFKGHKFPHLFILIFVFIIVIITYISGSFFMKDYLVVFLERTMDERGIDYLYTKIGNGILIMLPAYLSSLFFSRVFLSITKDYVSVENKEFELAKIVYSVNLLSSFFYLLFCVTPSFLRILVVPSILNSFIMGRIIEKKYITRTNKNAIIKLYVCFIMMVISWIIPINFGLFEISAQNWIDTTLKFLNF